MAAQSLAPRKAQRIFGIVLILSITIFAFSSLNGTDSGGTGPVTPEPEGNLVETLSLISSIGSMIGLLITSAIGIRRERRASRNDRLKKRLQDIRLEKEKVALEREKLELEKLKTGVNSLRRDDPVP